jgi:hypothetical protein
MPQGLRVPYDREDLQRLQVSLSVPGTAQVVRHEATQDERDLS